MLEKIKSTYFSRNIFSYIDEKRKLKLVNYNKKLQNKLNISLINYKLLSGKYIIHEGNDIWKIYDAFNDNLIFEGNYLNGIGREYDKENYNDKIYEGEYLNGKRSGKGKEYDGKGKLICEGTYKNGLRHGKCIEYYNDGKILLEGEYLNDKQWNTKEYDKNGNIINEIKNGKGILNDYYYLSDNLIFKGECLNGLRNGKGKEYSDDGKLRFEGEYLYDYKIKGKYYYINGKLKYDGEFRYDMEWNGKGFDLNGNIIYEISNGKGYIKEFDGNGELLFEGEYLNGKRNGKGREYYDDGYLEFEGEYLNGKRKEI